MAAAGEIDVGLRETINESPRVRYTVTGITVAALALLVFQQFSSGSRTLSQAWFTIDGGVTWFADDAKKLPPFQKDGKTAVGCQLYTCDGGKTRFVGFLYRYRAEAAAKFAAVPRPSSSSQQDLDDYAMRREVVETATREVRRAKAPDDAWVLAKSTEGAAVTTVQCPTPGGELESVVP